MCGEKKLADFDEDSGKGSPPRMRGKVSAATASEAADAGITPAYAGKAEACQWSLHRWLTGITPAYAGKSYIRFIISFFTPSDHPRVRGEKFCAVTANRSEDCRDHPRVCGEKAIDLLRSAAVFARDHPRVCGEKLLLHRSSSSQRMVVDHPSQT